MSTEARTPVWIYIVFGLQLLLTLAFFLLGWSMTASFSQGRSIATIDILALAAPALLTVICGVLAAIAARKQNKGLAVLLAILPVPAAFVLYGVVGAI